jgi:predicted MPP superfamily phosphohydrolase
VARAIEQDVKNCPWIIDRIFVTGDIAYSADRSQYESAQLWLKQLGSLDHVRLVPGNHDIDRIGADDIVTQSLHSVARVDPLKISDMLAHADARSRLGQKLREYCDFVSQFRGHPGAINGLDWFEVIDLTSKNGGLIRVVGLSSVWVSDRSDGRHGTADDVFMPNMVLSNLQMEQTMGDAARSDLLIVLTHHPPEWLHPTCSGLLGRFLARRPHVHLCGHVHDMRARFQRDFGAGRWLRYVVGASHGDPDEPAKYAYAWGALRMNEAAGSWEIGWAPRIYVADREEFRADRSLYDLDDKGFAWESIGLDW